MTVEDTSSSEIYVKYRDALTRLAMVLVGPSDANDVISTVITRTIASGRSLGDLDNPRAYLMRAVANESKTLLRSRGRTTELVETIANNVAVPRPEVLRAVMALPPQQRAATYLVYWVGMNSREAAAVLRCRPATTRRYLLLARRRLRGVLDGNN